MKRDVLLHCIQKITGNNLKHFTNIELKDWVKDYLKSKKSNKNLDKNKMETKYHCEKSANGFDMSTLKSAIQKYIRRGNEDMALRSLEEIDRFAEVEGRSGERLRTNMLHRLQIIFLEDIALGNYHLWKNMCEWMDILYNEREKDPKKRNRALEIQTLKKIVINLCQSKKTRVCSFMNSLTQLLKEDEKAVNDHFGGYFFMIPEDVEKSHKKMLQLFDEMLSKKDWKAIHYLRKLFKDSGEKSEPIKEIEKVMEKYKIDLTCPKKWKKDKQSILKLNEGFLLYMLPLGYYLYGSEPLQLNEEINEEIDWPKRGPFKLDDFVYDKHTKYAIDRSTEYFVKETSKVSNEVFILPAEFKSIYEWSRCGKIIPKITCVSWHKKNTEDGETFYYQCDEHGNFIKDSQTWKNPSEKSEEGEESDTQSTVPELSKETDLDFVVRIQLTTSDQKQDTYYAEYNSDLYFVKGPFRDRSVVDEYVRFQTLKKERGFPYMKDVYCVMMYPDRWTPEETPIGYRKSIDPTKKYAFLIAKSLFPKDTLKTHIHSSVKWPLTKVIDDRQTDGMRVNVFELEDQMMVDYLNAIGFRLEYNIGDFADRNFLRISSMCSNDPSKEPTRVLSVDEEVMKNRKISLKSELKSDKKYEQVMNAFKQYKDQLDPKTVEMFEAE